jgi:hypothetical protein
MFRHVAKREIHFQSAANDGRRARTGGSMRGIAVAGCIVLVACGGSVGTSASGTPDGGSDTTAPASSPIDGVWQGYIESFKLPSGSDQLTASISVSATGAVMGTLVFGGYPATLPPPTDPNVGYPPDFRPERTMVVAESFAYDVLQGTSTGSAPTRVVVKIQPSQVWKQWCELQTEIYEWPSSGGGPSMYGCLPNWGFTSGSVCSQPDPATGESVPRDCGKLSLCVVTMQCRCTKTGCTVPLDSPGLALDMSISGDSATGTINLGTGTTNVHLKKVK